MEYDVMFKGKKYKATLCKYAKKDQNCIILKSNRMDDDVTASVCLIDVELQKDEVAIKNYSENSGVEEALILSGIIEKSPEWSVNTGYVTVNVYKIRGAK